MIIAQARRFCYTVLRGHIWYYGSKREYKTQHLSGKPNEVAHFATHVPPKDDTVLSTGRLFYETAHPRRDSQPPEPIGDLAVRVLGEGQAEVRFTAPADSPPATAAGSATSPHRRNERTGVLGGGVYNQGIRWFFPAA